MLLAHKRSNLTENWRRRPDLNRGRRFCRLSKETYVVDSSCFLVSAKPSFYPLFGRFWTHVGPKFWVEVFLSLGALEASSFGPPMTPVWEGCGLTFGPKFGWRFARSAVDNQRGVLPVRRLS